jgi:hypothetical protein
MLNEEEIKARKKKYNEKYRNKSKEISRIEELPDDYVEPQNSEKVVENSQIVVKIDTSTNSEQITIDKTTYDFLYSLALKQYSQEKEEKEEIIEVKEEIIEDEVIVEEVIEKVKPKHQRNDTFYMDLLKASLMVVVPQIGLSMYRRIPEYLNKQKQIQEAQSTPAVPQTATQPSELTREQLFQIALDQKNTIQKLIETMKKMEEYIVKSQSQNNTCLPSQQNQPMF